MVNELTKLRAENQKSDFWIGGDFNLPDVDWPNLTVSSNRYQRTMSSTYINLSAQCGVEQAANFPKRGDNTLDLFFTNNPSLLDKCKAIPGVGDHKAVLIDTNIKPRRFKPVRRTIYLWDRADRDPLKADTNLFVEDFLTTNFESVNTMWTYFRDSILSLMNKHVPHKQTRPRLTNPWMNTNTRRLVRKKQQAFKKTKTTNSPKDVKRYKSLKAECQKEIRKAHDSYLYDIISPDAKSNPKKFWSFIKGKKQESTVGCCNALRTYSRLLRSNQLKTVLHRNFGQPVAQTHPHLLKQGEVTPFVTKEEYSLRRHNVFKRALDQFEGSKNVKDHIMIFPSACRLYMTIPIPYPFRQNTDFLYLSGFQEADSVLILHNSQNAPAANSSPNPKSGVTSVLFVPKKDPNAELWEGERSGPRGAEAITGVDGAHNTEDLSQFLQDYCKNHSDYMVWYDVEGKVHPQLHRAGIEDFILQGKQKCVETTTRHVHQTRVIKSPAEVQLMQKSVDIASESLEEVMKFSYPQVNESYLQAKMEYECKLRDAQMLAYQPVVAGGNRGNTIHYTRNNQIVPAGDMVLMDAGCEYHGFTSDLTRTWPVSGRFSPAQRRLYEMVLRIQLKVISFCTPEFTLERIYVWMFHLLGEELVSLGLLKPKEMTSTFYTDLRVFYPHHVGHFLGMDVHDTPTVSRNTNLQPGMIIAIEPGIYIPANRTDVPEEYRGIAIRIEDNILITESQPIVLSANCVKDPDHIEEMMSAKS